MFFTRDLYPNLGAMWTAGSTIPEPEEHVALAQTKPEEQAPSNVAPQAKLSLFAWVGVIVLIMCLFQMGR